MKEIVLIELGELAVSMREAELKVRAWLDAEAREMRLRNADQSPDWPACVEAQQRFNQVLNSSVDARS